MMHDSWDMEYNRQIFLSLWTIFCPFTPTEVYHKWQSYDIRFLRYQLQQTGFFCVLGPFFALLPLTAKKWKYKKKIENMKKMPGDIIISSSVPKIMIIGSWDMACDGCNCYCSFWAIFYPPDSPKSEHFKKMKKTPGDIIILQNCTKNFDYRLYCSWDMACDTCNFYFSFWAFFSPFIPITTLKIKIS